MMQQTQSPCDACNGEGQIINPDDYCLKCSGDKVIDVDKKLKLFVKKGVKENEKIIFKGEADEYPDVDPGDIIFVISIKKHGIFERSNNDLVINKKITLTEALTGINFIIKHLDNRDILVKSDELIQPNSQKCIANEGMPILNDPFDKGYLIINFDVILPEIEKDKYGQLQSLLNENIKIIDNKNNKYEEVILTSMDNYIQTNNSSNNTHEEDEHQHMQGPDGVQCAQQ